MIDSHSRPTRVYQWSLALAVAGLLAFSVDLPLARWFLAGNCPHEIERLLHLAEIFAHGLGVGCLLLTIWVLDPPRRRSLLRMLTCSIGAGIVDNGIKMLIGRTRPKALPDDFQGSAIDTFRGLLPLWTEGNAGQSFPSGHSAAAAGLAVVLLWYYPRGKWLFPLFAVLAAGQRLESGSHFLSDALIGAAVGCLVAGVCLDPRLAGRWFDRFEDRTGLEGEEVEEG